MIRKARAAWRGTGRDGDGELSSDSGVLAETPYSYRTRFENQKGTNPEELIAAAHAGCFTMALAFQLQGAGYTPTGPAGVSATAFKFNHRATRQLTSFGPRSMDNRSAAMSVKPPTKPMLGATAQLTAQLPIDGLGLRPKAAAEAKVHAPDTDAALVDAIRRGDAGSREALYHRFKRRVYALAVRIVGTVDAEEVAQEAFIRIFRGLTKFRGDAALATWIYRLAVNAALSHRSRRAAVAQPEAPEAVEAQASAEPVRGDAVLRVRIERALARLPVGYRTVIVLHDVEGLEHEEVAQILGCHVGTSKSQLHKARARLREMLAADGITAAALETG